MKQPFTVIASCLLAGGSLLASAQTPTTDGHGDHHGQAAMVSDDMDMGSMRMDRMDMSQVKKLPDTPADAPAGHGARGGHAMHAGHAHESWVEPPAEFADATFDQWDNFERAKAGMAVYRDNCAGCHGIDGRGSGPLASKLKHPPADLTNHFHAAPGQGDQYLFWRVTEGGVVEPFASQDSAMPAFKHSLSESQRWDVLAYLHQAFHRGFKQDAMMPAAAKHGQGHH